MFNQGCNCNCNTSTAPLHSQAAKTKRKEMQIIKREWIPTEDGNGYRPPRKMLREELTNQALTELSEEDEIEAYEEKERRERPWYRKVFGTN